MFQFFGIHMTPLGNHLLEPAEDETAEPAEDKKADDSDVKDVPMSS